MSDDFVREALDAGSLRPVAGTLWCEKYTPGREQVYIDGLGLVSVANETASGIVLISGDAEADNVLASLLVVRAIGDDPARWSVRYADRSASWENRRKTDLAYPANWENQMVEVGTVIAIRAVAGEGQSRTSQFLQVRYDEIVAIGTPLDSDEIPMLPAPGWVIVEPASEAYDGAVYVGAMETSQVGWGVVIGHARGLAEEDMPVGSTVAYPLHRMGGATEYVTFEGGLRAVPIYDILAVQVDED